jgi:hypothetical protein
VPAVLLSFFVFAASNVNDWDGVAVSVSLALLTYVQLYSQIRENISKTRQVTTMEGVLLFYMFYCILPLVDKLYHSYWNFYLPERIPQTDLYLKGMPSFYVFLCINSFFTWYMLVLNCSQEKIARVRLPDDKQNKSKAEKDSPDATWIPPVDPKEAEKKAKKRPQKKAS